MSAEHLYLGVGYLGAGLGAGLTVIGAGLGIGKAVAAAAEATGRQPEAAGAIKGSMQLFVFLIEGLAIVGLIVSLLIVLNLGLKPLPAPTAAAVPAVQTAH